jgi:hypothetical protein
VKGMADYSKMKCYDMRMYLFEWVNNNPEVGSDIKYIHNMSKSQLIKVCLYTEEKISKSELIETIVDAKNIMKEYKKRMKDKKEKNSNDDDATSADSYDSNNVENNLKSISLIISKNNAPETEYYSADEEFDDE